MMTGVAPLPTVMADSPWLFTDMNASLHSQVGLFKFQMSRRSWRKQVRNLITVAIAWAPSPEKAS